MASLNIWYLHDQARLLAEEAALAQLSTQVSWLTIGAFRFDNLGRLVVDCDIDIGHRVHEACLRYPALFPLSPPTIYPRDGTSRWSAHQYGAGGDLCLEYRADNWSPEITGAQMMESAYHLLHGENPNAQDRVRVLSAHQTTFGQRFRGTYLRLVLTRWSQAQLAALVPDAMATAHYHYVSTSHDNMTFVLNKITVGTNDPAIDPSVPLESLDGYSERPAIIRCLDATETLPSVESREAFLDDLDALGLPHEEGLFVFVRGDSIHAARLFDTVLCNVAVVPAPAGHDRSGADHAALGQKKVAIIGCGSLGSKVATTLARSGCGLFVLVDDDLLLPDNLVRHDLDWRDVGMHKADALARRLKLVSPFVDVDTRIVQLGGQVSATTAEGLLTVLARCDLIVNATANPEVGSILSSVPQRTGVPVVWGEVFSGGVGGLIARTRKDREPSIVLMRRAIENWFATYHPTHRDEDRPAEPYADQGENPVIADDGDVSFIASALARLGLDTLLNRDPSAFPHSAYVIGMAADDLFSGTFDTRPIELPPPPLEPEYAALSPDQGREAVTFIMEIISNSASTL